MDAMMMLEDDTVTGRDGEVTNVEQVHLSWRYKDVDYLPNFGVFSISVAGMSSIKGK